MKEISYEEERAPEEKKPARSIGNEKVHALRTYGADAGEMLVHKQISKIDIIEAEAKRREERGEARLVHDETAGSHLGVFIGALVLLLVVGLGVGAYALFGGMPKNIVSFGTGGGLLSGGTRGNEPAQAEPIEITITNSPREQIIADISIAFSETTLPRDGTRTIRFLTGESSSRPAAPSEFLSAAASHVPDTLTRAFGQTFEYRIHMADRASGTIILPVRSYPDAFSGMLAWEPRMPSGLVPLLSPWVDRKGLLQLEISSSMRFSDVRIGSADARVLKDASGKELLVYGFPTKELLVIASTQSGFQHAVVAPAQAE